MEKIILKDKRFYNESGKEVLLHGLNVLCRSRENGHFYPELEKDFPYFRNMGFNLLRLGIFWDGAEPEPGKIDADYLHRVKEIVRTAEQYGLYIMLDMHQDLFAQKFIDGAPDWACLDEGLPHPDSCKLWYEAYLQSDAIIRAADNFWANKPAADGVGLLDHYTAMWEEIARVFADCDNVIGFEPMNEPFMGSLAREAFGAATVQMMQKNPAFDLNRPEAIPPEQAVEFIGLVGARFMDFDRTTLMDFYRRMERAIRKYSDKAVVTGGNIYCSTDMTTGLERLETAQIYAPHGYDSVVDSDRYDSFSKENVERLYAGKRASQQRLNLPVIVGEWGAFPSRDFTNDLIRHMNGILEQNLWGDTYCEYHPGMDRDPNFTSLCRAYPMETAGELESYHYAESANRVSISFMAKSGQESKVFCPFVPKKVICSLPCESRIEMLDGACICYVKVLEAGKADLQLEG